MHICRLLLRIYPLVVLYLTCLAPVNGEGDGGGSGGGVPGAETAIWAKSRLGCEEYSLASSNPVFSVFDSVGVGTPNGRAGKRFDTGTGAECWLNFEEWDASRLCIGIPRIQSADGIIILASFCLTV